ncbi:hypothetical protein CLUG_02738 [Clavispora lusitaniae ATCC 42720]|uniref:Uncharacterized protein n=1 Tax=Clavispora lusitaniae (strain ATCC 42720) TaxID=306902 RepID=C4Y2H5_CLAL4|nr:uncharacterized protein CLUG_02738 [Clavispora lusitaniae ATCC 42720]EEQ38612.1 hypothetical protein CLUG_02738 [Clavispora lusitaniae ATCC 42720]
MNKWAPTMNKGNQYCPHGICSCYNVIQLWPIKVSVSAIERQYLVQHVSFELRMSRVPASPNSASAINPMFHSSSLSSLFLDFFSYFPSLYFPSLLRKETRHCFCCRQLFCLRLRRLSLFFWLLLWLPHIGAGGGRLPFSAPFGVAQGGADFRQRERFPSRSAQSGAKLAAGPPRVHEIAVVAARASVVVVGAAVCFGEIRNGRQLAVDRAPAVPLLVQSGHGLVGASRVAIAHIHVAAEMEVFVFTHHHSLNFAASGGVGVNVGVESVKRFGRHFVLFGALRVQVGKKHGFRLCGSDVLSRALIAMATGADFSVECAYGSGIHGEEME